MPQHQLACVAVDGAHREARQFFIAQGNGIINLVGERAKAISWPLLLF